MKPLLKTYIAALCIALTACGTSTKVLTTGTGKPLTGKTVCFVVELAGGSVTTSGVGVSVTNGSVVSSNGNTSGIFGGSALTVSHTMDGKDHAMLAAKDLELELRSAGLRMTHRPNDANIIATFYIGSCRFDPVAGWIADKSFIDFRDAKTGQSVAMIRGDTRWVTPTIRSHIRTLTVSAKQLF